MVLNKINKNEVTYIKHKYLKDIDIKLKDTPYGWCKDDKRQKQWKEQRNTYGFDERETWALDTTFFYWLYERLMMFNEVNIINTNFEKIKIDNTELTLQECIDAMILGCKKYIKYHECTNEDEKLAYNIGEETLKIFTKSIWRLGW